jgi:gamma-glutamyltranspeptidase/glutathione hydrolase
MTFDWQLPYPANRQPVFAQNMVATSQPLATAAGLAALKAGGNAVDAALAAAITLTVVEPNNNGIGSDAFALIFDGQDLHGINGSGRTPRDLLTADYLNKRRMPGLGWHSVTVPGAVNVWSTLSERFGQLPFKALFDAAIDYAENGYLVGPKTAFYWQHAQRTYRDFPEFQATFFPDGQIPSIGSLVRLPQHGETLKRIRDSQGEDFYQGELAERMIRDANLSGYPLAKADLAEHRAEWVTPISTAFSGARLFEIPPNGQGLMALIALGLLEHWDLGQFELDDADTIHLQVEAIRYAWQQVAQHLADPASMTETVGALMDPETLRQAAHALRLDCVQGPPPELGVSRDTVYLTTADAQGMMVSLIQSNFRGFGSGIVVPGTGISLQNRGSGFNTQAGHPNCIGPNKRPFHTIIPGFAFLNDQPFMSFGVMGGHMQAQGHVQMMVRMIIHAQNPQAASDAPRWHLTEGGELALEPGFSEDTIASLRARGHALKINEPEHIFGGAQLIARIEGGYCGGSDHRKEGLAAGF